MKPAPGNSGMLWVKKKKKKKKKKGKRTKTRFKSYTAFKQKPLHDGDFEVGLGKKARKHRWAPLMASRKRLVVPASPAGGNSAFPQRHEGPGAPLPYVVPQ